jgi:hypothetical protein
MGGWVETRQSPAGEVEDVAGCTSSGKNRWWGKEKVRKVKKR